jgi:DNA modification methylase
MSTTELELNENVQLWPLARFVPYARNPRKNDAAVARMIGSIKEFGFKIPILARSDGLIVDGHLRLKAAAEMGIAELPVILCDEWSEAQVKAFRLLANRSVAWAEWDEELLRFEFQDLAALDFDLDLTGFDEKEWEGFLEPQGTAGLTEPDDVPDVPETAVSQPGDIWLMGKHRLICGDATNAEAVARILQGERPALLLTDPPYGINIVQTSGATVGGSKPVTIKGTIRAHGAYPFGGKKNMKGKVGGGGWVDANEYLQIHGDDKPFDPAHLFGLAEHLIFFGGNYFASKLPDSRCWLVWDKNNTGHFADCELAWTSLDKGVTLFRHTWNGLVRQGPRNEELVKRIHPTQKPVGLFAEILDKFAPSGALILDPYLGSGTSLIAAERTARTCYAMEIEPLYVDVAVRRWQDFTGKDGVLEGTGKTFAEVQAEREKVAS